MLLNDFNYVLPKELIAQTQLPIRSDARLMVLDRRTQTITHRHIRDLPEILTSNDVFVFNETKVFPARIKGKIQYHPEENEKRERPFANATGLLEGKNVEILLHRELAPN